MQNNGSLGRRRFMDLLARCVVVAGGLAIIVSVCGILLFILIEVFPLLVSPSHNVEPARTIADGPLFVGCEEYDEVAFAVLPNGSVRFVSLSEGAIRGSSPALDRPVTAVYQPLNTYQLHLGLDDGRAVPVTMSFDLTFRDDPQDRIRQLRTINPSAAAGTPVVIDDQGKALKALAYRDGQGATRAYVAITADDRVVFLHQLEKKTLAGGVKRTEKRHALDVVKPTCVLVDHSLQQVYVGTADGAIAHFDVSDPDAPRFVRSTPVSKAAITALQFLNGDVSIVAGDAGGGVGIWFQVRNPTSETGWTLTHIRDLEPHDAAITSIWPSIRDKGFVTADAKGAVKLHHSTSEQTFLTLKAKDLPVRGAFLSPRSTAALALHTDGSVQKWAITNHHPETTLRTLFGTVWYEGYEKPEYVWQSTGGTDDFEPKFSLMPLMFGTLKGTFYALIIGVPLALLGALFTSQFLHPKIRGAVKPVIEIMAALPSVVLGFLAGLWLAPYMEKIVPAIFSMAIVLPAFAIVAMAAWNLTPVWFRTRWRERLELGFLLVAMVLGVWVCLQISGPIESALFKDDFGQWWFSATGLKYDQRNALVVGFAMGFAVIPIIFTISEDSLANVPRHLTSGSLALGATRWQTAVRVVLPTASPGIFSAILVGFGRAVGETMIVLMATGNTPVMEWNLFNGFRTLSANIAVEIPEAPHGETHYRALFLAALLLFLCTFLVNTAAEGIRMRMRKRYAQL